MLIWSLPLAYTEYNREKIILSIKNTEKKFKLSNFFPYFLKSFYFLIIFSSIIICLIVEIFNSININIDFTVAIFISLVINFIISYIIFLYKNYYIYFNNNSIIVKNDLLNKSYIFSIYDNPKIVIYENKFLSSGYFQKHYELQIFNDNSYVSIPLIVFKRKTLDEFYNNLNYVLTENINK